MAVILELHNLTTTYNNILQEYNAEIDNYLLLVSSSSTDYTNYPNKKFSADLTNTNLFTKLTADSSNTPITSSNQCSALCSGECKGWTYHSNACYITKDIYNLETAVGYQTGIPKIAESLIRILQLNQQLIDTNVKIITIQAQVDALDTSNKVSEKMISLNDVNEDLEVERRKYEILLNHANSARNVYNETSIALSRINIQYSMWMFFALLAIIIIVLLIIL